MAGGPWLLVALVVLWGDRGWGDACPSPKPWRCARTLGALLARSATSCRLFPAAPRPPGASTGRAGLPGEGRSSATAGAGSSSLTIVGAHQRLVRGGGGGRAPGEGAGVWGPPRGAPWVWTHRSPRAPERQGEATGQVLRAGGGAGARPAGVRRSGRTGRLSSQGRRAGPLPGRT